MRHVVVENVVASEDACILGIEAEHESHAEYVEVAERVGVVVAIFPYERIVEFPYYRTCLHRNLKFLLQMFVASLHEKLQTIVFASKVF